MIIDRYKNTGITITSAVWFSLFCQFLSKNFGFYSFSAPSTLRQPGLNLPAELLPLQFQHFSSDWCSLW